ncbi:VOC family protein [Gordonia sp. (in: high G+C Gram-positive bacteria)]|uniref:VOC family protein n=1 Tax=Gordonia sp. (in: high G+C Gram-positive bacteria) TaxID=84139 RepID=UPI0039E4DC80
MTVTGPDFIALQVRDLDAAAAFYETSLGLNRAPVAPPGAVVFATGTIPFAVREPLPGVDLAQASPRPGFGVALWLKCESAPELHVRLRAAGTPIVADPAPGPFGVAFTFLDPDGYAITVHDG